MKKYQFPQYFFDQFWGVEINGKVKNKYISWIIKLWSKQKFLLDAINQLKNTSDCIKIDPPGPGRNLKKSQKSRKNGPYF